MLFSEALGYLLNKEDLPAEWDAAMWQEQETDFQTKAFFSAKMENARFLDRAHGLLFDYMAKVRETIVQPDGTVVTALKVSDRAHFVERLTKFMLEEGMVKPGEISTVNQKDITDIRSRARLNLIFDTNVRQAYGYGQWKQGMTPAALKAFPAARLIRDMAVKVPRPRHEENLGEVLLKTDPRWADFHNAREIGGFGVPWGPYGFNSGCTQEDVSKAEARNLGLPVESQEPTPAKVTDGTEASVKKMDPEIKRKLLEELRSGPKPKDPAEAGREAAAKTRRIMLDRGLADAEGRGDVSKAAKYRKAIAELPTHGLDVREDGSMIRLMPPPPPENEFRQPELTGPRGIPVFVPEDIKARMLADMDHLGAGGGGFTPLEGLSESAQKVVKSFGNSIRDNIREHVRVFDPVGNEKYRKIGDLDNVPVDLGSLPGNVAIHNHPNGTPPSLKDILVAMEGQALEIEVVTSAHTFSLRAVDGAVRGNVVLQWGHLNEMSHAVGQEWRRSKADETTERDIGQRRLHALLMELARQGMILYIRNVNVQ